MSLRAHLPSIMSESIDELSERFQVAPEMVLTTLLGASSGVCAGIADIELPGGFQQPLILHTVVGLSTGSGKSPLMGFVEQAIARCEARFADAYYTQLKRHEASRLAFAQIKKSLEAKIRDAEPDELVSLQARLTDLLMREATPPISSRLIVAKDSTVTGIQESLAEESPYGLLMSAEGKTAFERFAAGNPQFIAERWDGDDVDVRRKGRHLRTRGGTRLAVVLAAQNDQLQRVLSRSLDATRSAGYLARVLFTFAPSHVGFRNFGQPAFDAVAFGRLAARWAWLLELAYDDQKAQFRPRRALLLSEHAAGLWAQARQGIEYAMQPGGPLFGLEDFGSKMPAHIGRIAGILALLEADDWVVQVRHVQCAIDLAWFYAGQFQHAVQPPRQPTERERHCGQLWQTLDQRLQMHGPQTYTLRELQRFVRGALRHGHLLELAIFDLAQQGVVSAINDAKTGALHSVAYPIASRWGATSRRLV